jgi:hypothetical protein
MKYFIGEIGFKTKKDCYNYVKNIIINLGCCDIDKNNNNYSFFYNVLKNHPEFEIKLGCGAEFFRIQLDYFNNYQICLYRPDNTNEIFSWVQCCNFKGKSIKELLISSMRYTIKDDMINFKTKEFEKLNKLVCNQCNIDNLIYHDYHVDHLIKFKDISTEFLKITSLKIPVEFTSCNQTQMTCFTDKNIDFNNDWYNYHQKKCSLRILCKNCNLTRH